MHVLLYYGNVSHWSILSILWSMGESPQIHTQAIECGHAPDTACLKMIHHQNTDKNHFCCKLCTALSCPVHFYIIHIIFSHSQISNPGVLCYSLMSMSNNNISDEVSNNAMNLCAGAGHFQKFVTVMFCFVTHCHCHECHVTSSSLSQRETQTMPIERKQITRKSTAHKNCIVANNFIVTKCKLTNLFPWCVINSL